MTFRRRVSSSGGGVDFVITADMLKPFSGTTYIDYIVTGTPNRTTVNSGYSGNSYSGNFYVTYAPEYYSLNDYEHFQSFERHTAHGSTLYYVEVYEDFGETGTWYPDSYEEPTLVLYSSVSGILVTEVLLADANIDLIGDMCYADLVIVAPGTGITRPTSLGFTGTNTINLDNLTYNYNKPLTYKILKKYDLLYLLKNEYL